MKEFYSLVIGMALAFAVYMGCFMLASAIGGGGVPLGILAILIIAGGICGICALFRSIG